MITLEHAREISLSKIATLQPDFGSRVRAWYDECHAHDLWVYIYEGYRTPQRQGELYAQGRVTEGKIVTNAKPGQSFHNFRLAIDWVPLLAHPKIYDMKLIPIKGEYEAWWDAGTFYAAGQAKAHRYNLRAISWETPHLEDNTYLDYRELQEKFPLE